MQVDSEESPKDVPMEDVQPTLDTEAAPPDEPPEVVDSLQNGSLSERKPDLTQEQGGSVAQTPVPAASPVAAASTSESPEPKKPSDNPHYRTTYIMSGHTRSISSLKFSPDGKLLAFGSSDLTVGVLDASSLAVRYQQSLHIPSHWFILMPYSRY